MDNIWIFVVLILLAENLTSQEINRDPERRYACWGSFGPPVVSAQCPRGTTIHVRKAGLKVASNSQTCRYSANDCGCEYGEAGCNMPNVRDLCMGRPACRLDVTQQYINTDTCRGFSDYMYIEFDCIPVEKTSIQSICSNTEDDKEFGYIKGPSSLIADGRTQCDCTLTTSPYSEMSVVLLDYHSIGYSCGQEKLVIQYGGQAQQFCSDRYEGGQNISAGVNKISLTFNTEGREQAGGFWLKYQAIPTAAVKLQCAYTVEPKTPREKKITRNIYKPLPRKPTTVAPNLNTPLDKSTLDSDSIPTMQPKRNTTKKKKVPTATLR